MSSMNHFGEEPASSKNTTVDPVKKPAVAYNLDDFALPHFALKTLQLTNVPPDVRTWRELTDYVRANLRSLPPFILERTLKLQTDYSRAGPAERTCIPAMKPTIKHVTVQGGKGRSGTTFRGAVTSQTKMNKNVPGAAQSQGLAQIAIGSRELPSDPGRKEAIPANLSVASGVASGVTREPHLQAPRNEAITRVSSVPSGPRGYLATLVSHKEATPAWGAAPGAHRGHPLPAPRKEATPANWSAAPGAHLEQASQVWSKEATSANWSAAPGAHGQHPQQASRREATPAKWSSAPGAHRENPQQASRREATPANWSAAPGAHREHPQQVSRREATPANWSAAPGAHLEHASKVWRKEATPANWSVAPGAHLEHASKVWRKEATPANWSAAPGAHREHPTQASRREAIAVNFNAAPGAHRENLSQVSRKEAIQANWSAAPGAHREHQSQATRKEVIQENQIAAPAGTGGYSPTVSRRDAIPLEWIAARGAQRRISSQASLQEAVPMNWSSSSGLPRELSSESPRKEATPVKDSVAPAIFMRGMSKQKAVSTATEATFGQANSAMANTPKVAPQGVQNPATRVTAKGDQSLKSVSVNLNTNETAKSLKSAPKGHEVGKIEAEQEEMVPTPMGELIDISIPISARSPPQPFHPITRGIRHHNGYNRTGENNPRMPALAAIPALIPSRKSDAQTQGFAKGPPLSYLPRALLPPPAPTTLSRHSSSTRSRSNSLFSRSPSPEKSKAAEPTGPRQAGRYYLVHKEDGGIDYVWVAGAQRGDPCPPHLNPVE